MPAETSGDMRDGLSSANLAIDRALNFVCAASNSMCCLTKLRQQNLCSEYFNTAGNEEVAMPRESFRSHTR